MAGLMYSLVALGIVLIYKSSSVPNLAQGAMTMLGAYFVLEVARYWARADVGRDPARDAADVRRRAWASSGSRCAASPAGRSS